MKFKILEAYQDMQFDAIKMDPKKTGEHLYNIRLENPNLIKYVCRHSRFYKTINRAKIANTPDVVCLNNYDCKNCEVAKNEEEEKLTLGKKAYCNASLEALSRCFDKTVKEFSLMETAGTGVTIEKLLTYSYLTKMPLSELIVLTNEDFYFDENGVVRRKGDPEFTPITSDEK
ncbi:MAG: hypothetical protein J6B45_03095 [Clostridia bacterium]|nr:hypothetical protein [Clostridia bacterium]